MMRKYLIAVFMVGVFFLNGCASTAGIRVIKKNGVLTKQKDKGAVLFEFDCDGISTADIYLHFISNQMKESGKKPVGIYLHEKGIFNGNAKYDRTYYLLEMPVGEWCIKHVTDTSAATVGCMFGVIGYLTTYNVFNPELEHLDLCFTVKPDSILYLGTIVVKLENEFHFFKRSRQIVKFKEILDKEAEAKLILKELYPKIQVSLEKGVVCFRPTVQEDEEKSQERINEN